MSESYTNSPQSGEVISPTENLSIDILTGCREEAIAEMDVCRVGIEALEEQAGALDLIAVRLLQLVEHSELLAEADEWTAKVLEQAEPERRTQKSAR